MRGRWCLISVKTAAEPLTLHRLALDENRYPYENESRFDGGDDELAGVIQLAVRGIQMCAHETYMDCPFYEQLMYDGDTRLELLTTSVMTRDDRLVKRAIELFDFSRRNWGFVNERFPAYLPQHSPTFSMIWALMLSDYANWHNDPAFVKARAIGLRSMLEHFEPYVNGDGLLEDLPGWPFMDWVPQWNIGNAPDGVSGISALNNLLYVAALQKSAEIEDGLGEPLLAQRLRGKAARTAEAVQREILGRDPRAHRRQPRPHRVQRARPVPRAADRHPDRRPGQALLRATADRAGPQTHDDLLQLLSAGDVAEIRARRPDRRADELLEGPRQAGAQDAGGNARRHALRLPCLGQPSALPSARERCRHPPGLARIPHRPHRAPARQAAEDRQHARRIRTASSNSISRSTAIAATAASNCQPAITGVFVWQGKEQKLSGGANAVDLRP